MQFNYEKPEFYFVKGYRQNLDVLPPTRHLTTICCSDINRYPAQTFFIAKMMEYKRSGALKILNIGVAQGQEPLTHINSAYKLSKKTSRPISDFIDLKTVDILRFPPKLSADADKMDKNVINFLETVYDPRSGKSRWGTPIETVIDDMCRKNEKQDVILFNNVLQHMSPKNETALFEKLDKLLKLVNDSGIFCFTVSGHHNISEFEENRIFKMQKLLDDNGFSEVEVGTGIYTRNN